MSRESILSLTKKDFEVQTFRSGGRGGRKQDTSNTGVRIIHKDSRARGEARDSRSQHQNKRSAFKRLVESKEFQIWFKKRIAEVMCEIKEEEKIEERVNREMSPEKLKVEVKADGEWEEATCGS